VQSAPWQAVHTHLLEAHDKLFDILIKYAMNSEI
jgi:hypothetical protein